jgi:cell division protein ZapA
VELARIFDQQVRQISRDMGQLGDTRLFLMGALLLADELYDVRNQLAGLQAEVSRLETERSVIERRAVSALEAAAVRIERLGSADV